MIEIKKGTKDFIWIAGIFITMTIGAFSLFATKEQVQTLHEDIKEVRYDIKLLLRMCK